MYYSLCTHTHKCAWTYSSVHIHAEARAGALVSSSITSHSVALRKDLLTEPEAHPSARLASELLGYACYHLSVLEFQTQHAWIFTWLLEIRTQVFLHSTEPSPIIVSLYHFGSLFRSFIGSIVIIRLLLLYSPSFT